MAVSPVVALEIGTSKVVALVGEMRDDGHIMITGMGERPSSGVRKGEVIDIDNAKVCVRSVLAEAEDNGKFEILEVHLAVSGGHIQSVIAPGTVPVLDRETGITQEDMDQVMEVARSVSLPQDREVLHTICQHFCIDKQARVTNPLEMSGAQLSLNMLVLHGVRTRLDNTVRVIRGIQLDVADVVFSGLCSALAVLTLEQKKSGAVVIDLGGGKTDWVAYAEGVVADAGALGIGGDHVTNDITLAFSIPTSQAENLKRESGSAVVRAAAAGQRVAIPADGGFPGRSVNLRSLHTVIHARVDEILATIRRRLDHDGILDHVGAGIVLTGGGARLKGVTELAERLFGLPCMVATPRNVTGLAAVTNGPEYATCAGLVQYGFRSGSGQAPKSLFGWVRNVFGGRR